MSLCLPEREERCIPPSKKKTFTYTIAYVSTYVVVNTQSTLNIKRTNVSTVESLFQNLFEYLHTVHTDSDETLLVTSSERNEWDSVVTYDPWCLVLGSSSLSRAGFTL